MTLKKTLLASAVAGLLFSANAGAAVLGTGALTYASEIDNGSTLDATELDDAEVAVGYNFNDGELRYGRFECSANGTLENVSVTDSDGTLVFGAVNAAATGNAVFFSMTDDAVAAGGTAATNDIVVDADVTLEDGNTVTCALSVYDQPSQASSGGTTGRIATSGNLAYINRASGVVFNGVPATATADVEDAAGAYFGFDGSSSIGTLEYGVDNTVLDVDSNPVTLAAIFDGATTVTVDGDLSAAGSVTWTGYGADDGINTAEDSAQFDVGSTGVAAGSVTYDETGTDAIPEAAFTATLHGVTNTGYHFTDMTVDLGEIVRNGTQLQAPLVNVPANWISRVALTNTGNIARAYEISVSGESGVTIGTANLTGTVPANGTTVIDLKNVLTSFVGGNPRATLNVTVAGPNNQIQGLYQIVNPAAGSISNHVMVRPASN